MDMSWLNDKTIGQHLDCESPCYSCGAQWDENEMTHRDDCLYILLHEEEN